MNDRAVSVLENYDLNVLRTYKGRGAIVCETDHGLKVLREYRGTEERLEKIDLLLRTVREKSGFLLDAYLRNKEGQYISHDREQNSYILKDYYEGKECVPEDMEDVGKAFAHMAKMHKVMRVPLENAEEGLRDDSGSGEESVCGNGGGSGGESVCGNDGGSRNGKDSSDGGSYGCGNGLKHEIHKHNAELKRGKKFLRSRTNRSNFENYLLQNYDFFLNKALAIEEELSGEDFTSYDRMNQEEGAFCHGDFQYHNIVFTANGPAVMNFEKFQCDSGIKDFALFFRKVMEKNGWNTDCAEICAGEYFKERELSDQEKKLLLYRLSYPEKFWKIVNYYINSRKTVVMERNTDKLRKIMEQEEFREKGISFLEKIMYT